MNELTAFKGALDVSAFVFITNKRGEITYINEKFCHLLGYTPEELIGKNPRIFNSGHHSPSFFEEMWQNISQGKIWNGEVRNISKSGTLIWMNTTIFPFIPADSTELHYLCVRNDITKQIEGIKRKEQLITNLSHEIRSPLHGILNIIDLLSKTELDPEQEEYIHTIKSASENLHQFLNDILDLYKIGVGKTALSKSRFNVNEDLKSAISLYRPKAAQKKIRINSKLDPTIPALLEGDSIRFRQIISNLLDNAIKYTNDGHIEIDSILTEDTDKKSTVCILIKDTGIGIDPQKHELIFQKFFQASQNEGANFGGVGIGLHIVKELIDLMNGTIDVKSEIGKGSLFSVTLSFDKPLIIPISQLEMAPKSLPRNLHAKILIVDDSEINRMIFSKHMKKLELEHEFAKNGLEALDLIRSIRFDAILLDIQMPVMNGIEFMEVLSGNQEYAPFRSIPIIIVSAGNQKHLHRIFTGLNIREYLHKPFTIEEINLKLTHVLTDFSQTPVPEANKSNSECESLQLIDLSYLRELSDGDVDFMKDIISTFITESEANIQNIKTNLERGALSEVKSVAHKFAPHLAFVGLNPFIGLVEFLENNAENPAMKSELAEKAKNLECVIKRANEELKESINNL